jgi:hypothetical protein
MTIMGQLPAADILSLDDGIPYWPTLTAIAESPLERGVLYVGTDDGNLQVSRNGGATWTEVSGRLPDLPDDAWISGIEASRFVPGRVYVAANNYRNDDFDNYLFASEDFGMSWRALHGGLPPRRVTRTLREDPRNPEALYLGTEFGAFFSCDGGATWVALDLGLPTQPVNDLLIHPRDNDLVLATHGRGIWILDNLNALQELTPQVRASRAHLFSTGPAHQIRYRSEKGHDGDMIFRGQNPADGALLDFWLAGDQAATFSVRDESGLEVARMTVAGRGGVNRAVWNLRHSEPDQGAGETPGGPLVVPGRYTVLLEAEGTTSEQALEVGEDPRIQVDEGTRRQWTADLLVLAELSRLVGTGLGDITALAREVEGSASAAQALKDEAGELQRQWGELRARVRGLVGEVEGWVGPLTAQQASQQSHYQTMRAVLDGETRGLEERIRRLPVFGTRSTKEPAARGARAHPRTKP